MIFSPNKVMAVLVGIETYGSNKPLLGPASDAWRLAVWLISMGVLPENIALFLKPADAGMMKWGDQTSKFLEDVPEAQRSSVSEKCKTIRVREAKGSDLFDFVTEPRGSDDGFLFFHWGGHGKLGAADERFLILSEVKPNVIPFWDVQNMTAFLRSTDGFRCKRQAIFLDACGDPASLSQQATSYTPQGPAKGETDTSKQQLIFLASLAGQVADNITTSQEGIYTKVLLKCLRQWSEFNWTRFISLQSEVNSGFTTLPLALQKLLRQKSFSLFHRPIGGTYEQCPLSKDVSTARQEIDPVNQGVIREQIEGCTKLLDGSQRDRMATLPLAYLWIDGPLTVEILLENYCQTLPKLRELAALVGDVYEFEGEGIRFLEAMQETFYQVVPWSFVARFKLALKRLSIGDDTARSCLNLILEAADVNTNASIPYYRSALDHLADTPPLTDTNLFVEYVWLLERKAAGQKVEALRDLRLELIHELNLDANRIQASIDIKTPFRPSKLLVVVHTIKGNNEKNITAANLGLTLCHLDMWLADESKYESATRQWFASVQLNQLGEKIFEYLYDSIDSPNRLANYEVADDELTVEFMVPLALLHVGLEKLCSPSGVAIEEQLGLRFRITYRYGERLFNPRVVPAFTKWQRRWANFDPTLAPIEIPILADGAMWFCRAKKFGVHCKYLIDGNQNLAIGMTTQLVKPGAEAGSALTNLDYLLATGLPIFFWLRPSVEDSQTATIRIEQELHGLPVARWPEKLLDWRRRGTDEECPADDLRFAADPILVYDDPRLLPYHLLRDLGKTIPSAPTSE